MAVLKLGPEDALYYEWQPPARDGAPSFVFVNPITGDVSMWNAQLVPALHTAGYGTLVYNFRGQARSPCTGKACTHSRAGWRYHKVSGADGGAVPPATEAGSPLPVLTNWRSNRWAISPC